MIRATNHVKLSELHKHVGKTITVTGWAHTLRLQSKIQFVVLRDNSAMAQVTNKRTGDAIEQKLENLTVESAVRIVGEVVENPVVKLGGVEIVPTGVEVLSRAETPLPIDERTGPEQRLDWRFLDIRRTSRAQLIFAVQTTLEQGMREFAYANGCIEMHTPKLMGTASESGANVFKLDYFDRSAYLAQSPQFFKQTAIAAGFDGVFEIGPVFRAEPSFTARHATEFTGVDVELAWIFDVDDVMSFEEQMLRHALGKVAEQHSREIAEHLGMEVSVPSTPFPRVTMAEAKETLRTLGWGGGDRGDLDPEGERMLSAHVREQTGNPLVFVTDYPTAIRPFYHMRQADRPDLTMSFDLLWNGLEVTTGAQREHRYEVLMAQAAELSMDLEHMRDYLNNFRFGCPPHGGFGMGLSRMLMALLGLESIREATFLFRGPHRLTP